MVIPAHNGFNRYFKKEKGGEIGGGCARELVRDIQRGYHILDSSPAAVLVMPLTCRMEGLVTRVAGGEF
jgi:hypothetical protein